MTEIKKVQQIQNLQTETFQPQYYGLIFMAALAIGGTLTKYYIRNK